jgi:hypothetical protein
MQVPELLESEARNLLVARFLGASADYLQSRVALLSGYERANVTRIIERAINKVGISGLTNSAAVSVRTLGAVMDEAARSDDPVLDEYLAGILAMGHSANAIDDGGVTWAALIRNLSLSAIRLHFVIYRAMVETTQHPPASILTWSYTYSSQQLLGSVYGAVADSSMTRAALQLQNFLKRDVEALQAQDLLRVRSQTSGSSFVVDATSAGLGLLEIGIGTPGVFVPRYTGFKFDTNLPAISEIHDEEDDKTNG